MNDYSFAAGRGVVEIGFLPFTTSTPCGPTMTRKGKEWVLLRDTPLVKKNVSPNPFFSLFSRDRPGQSHDLHALPARRSFARWRVGSLRVSCIFWPSSAFPPPNHEARSTFSWRTVTMSTRGKWKAGKSSIACHPRKKYF